MADCMKDKPVLEKQDSVQWFILETIKALGLRPHAFICFSVSGYPGQALALVFDLLLHSVFRHQKVSHPPPPPTTTTTIPRLHCSFANGTNNVLN